MFGLYYIFRKVRSYLFLIREDNYIYLYIYIIYLMYAWKLLHPYHYANQYLNTF